MSVKLPDPLAVITLFYPEASPLKRLLLRHSCQVRDMALEILANSTGRKLGIDPVQAACGAMLHDIGIFRCRAPKILCEGTEPYIRHGILGAELLRALEREKGLALEPFARICERHTGTGITAEEIRAQGLPLPERDLLPETPLEKLICLADKFYSKSGLMEEKSAESIRLSLQKFGPDSVNRFGELQRMFGLQ